MKRKQRLAKQRRVVIDGKVMPSLGAWARLSTVGKSTLAKILKERRTPSYPTAEKLAGAMGVSTARLYRWLHEQAG